MDVGKGYLQNRKKWYQESIYQTTFDNNKDFSWFQFKFDNRLEFDIDWTCLNISNKISRLFGDYVQIKTVFTPNILRILYNSLILSRLQYFILSWDFKSDTLFKLQKGAVRIITCSQYNAHTKPLSQTLNYINYQQRPTLESYIYKTLYKRTTCQKTESIIEKLVTHSFRVSYLVFTFGTYLTSWNVHKFIIHHWLKIYRAPSSCSSSCSSSSSFFFFFFFFFFFLSSLP